MSNAYGEKLPDEPKIEIDESIVTEDVVQKDIVDMIGRQFPKQDVRVGDTVTVMKDPAMHVIRAIRFRVLKPGSRRTVGNVI